VRSILIVGAGIGGDTLALIMERAGWNVRVVEIAPDLRTGGQTVDLRGDSAAVLDSLGLLRWCKEARVEQRGIAWLSAEGRRIASMPVEAFGGQGFVSEDELLRSDLAAIIHGAGGTGITYWFGETVTGLRAVAGGVVASFRTHADEKFDFVVGADGTHSAVRAIAFGAEEQYRRPLGLAHAWFTLDESADTPPVDGWFEVHNATAGRVVEARPGHAGTQEIGFSFPGSSIENRRNRDAQFALLDETFVDVGWRTQELLAAARLAPDFAIDTFDQIHLDSWRRGRIVLLGDSAWCASPLSGLGTALALKGAERLAAALCAIDAASADESVEAALARYQEEMTPRVASAQKLLPGRVRMYAPRTNGGIRAVALVTTIVQWKALSWLLEKLVGSSGDAHRAMPTKQGS
jgi:2-polyprenyl-6-methoxyphenol hydroxylase-like FAD-dependent oxidoreductase